MVTGPLSFSFKVKRAPFLKHGYRATRLFLLRQNFPFLVKESLGESSAESSLLTGVYLEVQGRV